MNLSGMNDIYFPTEFEDATEKIAKFYTDRGEPVAVAIVEYALQEALERLILKILENPMEYMEFDFPAIHKQLEDKEEEWKKLWKH